MKFYCLSFKFLSCSAKIFLCLQGPLETPSSKNLDPLFTLTHSQTINSHKLKVLPNHLQLANPTTAPTPICAWPPPKDFLFGNILVGHWTETSFSFDGVANVNQLSVRAQHQRTINTAQCDICLFREKGKFES